VGKKKKTEEKRGKHTRTDRQGKIPSKVIIKREKQLKKSRDLGFLQTGENERAVKTVDTKVKNQVDGGTNPTGRRFAPPGTQGT